MNKTDLVNYITHKETGKEGLTKKDATEIVDVILAGITDSLINGEKVSLPGFGTFEVKDRAARQGQNPSTGEKMMIPASKNVKFTPGKPLKDAVKK